MKWTVLWKPDAESDLTNLWLTASDKADVTAAANRIDARLRKDPLHTGEPRADDRVYFDPPLGVLFTVDEMDRKVMIERVWRMPPNGKNGKSTHA
jgi:hypothetical protein